MFCNTCGSSNAEQAQFCEKCGAVVSQSRVAAVGAGTPGSSGPSTTHQAPPAYPGQQAYNDPRIRGGQSGGSGQYAVGKSPILALLLSFLIPGVGQFYNGDAKRGVPMFLIGFFSYILLLIPILGWAIAFGVHVWSMINAYTVADQKTPLG
jgi:TM2 domain-containing membrane protein YozV